jgi:hypothetical protein
MTDDPDQQEQYDDQGGGRRGPVYPAGPGGGGGGGGGLFNLLPLLLGGRGKGILLILLVIVAFYFFRGGCSGGGGGFLDQVGQLATGGFLDPREFEKASIYEPLADDNARNPLPEAVSLQRFAPPPGQQGQQGSCVAWSSAYAARSILEAARTGEKQTVFSPAFLYNQIGLEGCQGSYIIRAMEYMTKQGSVPYQQFPYDERDCSAQPDGSLLRDAAQYKMRGFTRLSQGDRNDAIDIRAIRENLAQGAPVVIGMMVGQSFMQDMMGKDLWIPEANDKGMMGFGGHAMCVVGYDDKKYGGAFLIMNSWGPEWGNNGFAWIRYPEFNYFVREAYGLDPMTKTGVAASAPLQAEVGLVSVEFDGKKTVPRGYIPLKRVDSNYYVSASPVRIGSRFKVEIKNSTECYIYIFGKETDESAYTLFPYPRKDDPSKTKYSPFCGITGYRLFPRDKSMTPDSIGKRDMIGIVLSRDSLDWYGIQQAINRQAQSVPFRNKMIAALKAARPQGVSYATTPKGTMQFTAPLKPGQAFWCFVEIDKQ